MSSLQMLSFQGQRVRMLEQDGQPWWVLRDVCEVLGIKQSVRVSERLDGDEVNQAHLADARGRRQKTTIISESGLYAVLLRSDKPLARPFRKWVTSEVLPSIRRTGSYTVPQVQPVQPALLSTAPAPLPPAAPKINPTYLHTTKCKICNSPLRETINRMIRAGDAHTLIATWAGERGLSITNSAVSRHRRGAHIRQGKRPALTPLKSSAPASQSIERAFEKVGRVLETRTLEQVTDRELVELYSDLAKAMAKKRR